MNPATPFNTRSGKSSFSPDYKRPRSDSLPSTGTSPSTSPKPPCCTEVSEILFSIANKLTGLDTRIALIEIVHQEFQSLRHSLEFSQEQIESLSKENKTLKNSVSAITDQLTSITTQLATVTADNKAMKETILDLQARSMRDNLVFTGIPERIVDNPEEAVKDFMINKLKLPIDTANRITFHHVHRLGQKNNNNRPRPIVAKFEHFKQKETVQRQGKQLKGTDFGMNDQFPKEIMERRKKLFPIRKQKIQEGKKAVISVDELYIDGQLYRHKDITPWLF